MSRRYLVLCTGNRCRSQMAHGWLAHFMPDARVFSAGTRPKGVHPLAIDVMREKGIDISTHTSDHVDRYQDEHFDTVVTVCDAAKEACPVFPNAKRTVHRSFEDPDHPELAQRDPAAFRALFCRIRDEIEAWAQDFARAEAA
jgi:arsenate reductase